MATFGKASRFPGRTGKNIDLHIHLLILNNSNPMSKEGHDVISFPKFHVFPCN